MIALEVSVNGERVCTAGVPDGVINCQVGTWSREARLDFSVGGLNITTKMHEKWATPKIQVGDEVTIRVIEADGVDAAAKFTPEPRLDSLTFERKRAED